MKHNGHLGTAEVGRLMYSHPDTISYHIRRGTLRASRNGHGQTAHGWRVEWADLVAYWRRFHEGRCVRCTIMGEATPERDFLCVPCEFEVRTGRIWWPDFPRPGRGGLPQGRLVFKLPDRWGVHVSW